ncbi:DUF2314 domain-containing protein [Pseudoalteromonas sp. GB56]
MKLVIVAIISLISLFPFLMFTTEVCGLNDNVGAIVSVILGWVILPSIMLSFWKGRPDPSVIPVDINDPIIQELIARSRAELNRFVEALDEGKKEAYIKFPYDFGGETEHVWGLAHSLKDGNVIVSLESNPVGEVPEDVYERLSIDLESVEDWMLVDRLGKTYGGYSILGLAKIYTRDYGKLPKGYVRDLERFVDFTWPENA